jgi:hypothetical protein
MTSAPPISEPLESAWPAVRPVGGLVLTIGFWGCLVAAGGLFAAVSLAPRVVVREQLEREAAARQSELLTLAQEIGRLELVARGLGEDSPLAAAVARSELQRSPAGVRTLPVPERLRHDPRDAAPEPIDVTYEEPLYLPVLQSLAQSPERRLRWSLAAAGLLLFGFVFLHEHAGSRAVGRMLIAPIGWLGRRYQRCG